jgi:phage-related protein
MEWRQHKASSQAWVKQLSIWVSGFKSMLGNALSFAAGQAIFNLAGDALGFLKDQFTGCLQESMDAEQEMAQTVKVLQSTHDASGMTADAIADLAAKFSHLTMFTDDQTQVGENLLLTFTNIGKKVFPQATQAMLDMSQAMGQDTKTSAIQLGKALNDPLTGMSALQRVGVTFTDEQKKLVKQMMETGNIAGAQGVILKELQREFGGSAEAAGKTFPGQLKILGQSFDDIKQKIGDAVMPLLKGFVSFIQSNVVPAVDSFANWITKTAIPALQSWVKWLGENVLPTLQKVGGFIGSIDWGTVFKKAGDLVGGLAKAMSDVAGAISKVDWGALVKGAQGAYQKIAAIDWGGILSKLQNAMHTVDGPAQHISQVFQQVWGVISKINWGGVFKTLMTALQQVGSFLGTTFKPVWDQLVHSFGDIQKAILPIMPQIRQFAQFLGTVLGVAIVLIIGLIAGLVSAFAGLLKGVIQVVTGIIQFFSGLVQFFSGIFAVIMDIFSGKWGKIAADLNNAMNGIMNMIIGVWNIIAGIFSAVFGTIQGFCQGFVSTVVGIFQGLANTLVGHSIIPDMINSIVNWFTQLPGRALGAVQSLLGNLAGFFSGLASQAITWGSNIIQGIIDGINAMVGNVTNAIGNIASIIGSFLPHSPAKEGELKHLNEYGPNLVNAFSKGIVDSAPTLKAAITHLVQPAASLGTPSSFSGGTALQFPTMAASTAQTIIINPPPIYLDGKLMARGLMPHITNQVRWTTGTKL